MSRIASSGINKQISGKGKMEYIRFGNTGMKVSRICLGTMSYGKPPLRASIGSWMKSRAGLIISGPWNWESISLIRPTSTARA